MFGLTLEGELDKCDGKTAKEIEGKRKRVLDKWLGNKPKFRNPPGVM